MAGRAKYLTACVVMLVSTIFISLSAEQHGQGTQVDLCSVLQTPQQYDGRQMNIEGTYRVALEASEIYSPACPRAGSVWVDFPNDGDANKAGRKIDRLISSHGTVTGMFTGIFHTGSHYGHEAAYLNKFSMISVRHLRVVDRLGLAPQR